MIEELLSHGHEFSFSQVMRVARMHLGAGGAQELPEVPWQDRIQVRPDLSLTFPASDVARVERAGADGADLLVTTTFLGLYGSSSPLPTHYTEDLLDDSAADSTVSREFLDLLHQRLYQLYFQCWSKYRLFIRVAEEKNPQDLERLYCLIGLGEKDLRESVPDAGSLLRYAGLFSQSPRSADGLKTLLRDALGVSKLEVEQCVLRRVPIPEDQQMRLGQFNISLGVNTVLGSEVPDRMGKFRIHIGPLSKDEFDTFLPGTTRHNKLARLIRLYIVDPFEFDLKLILATGEAQPIRLGDPDAPGLGWNSWCFSGDTLGEVSAIFPLAQSAPKGPAPVADDFSSKTERTEPSNLIGLYQQELSRLRDLAASFADTHPEVASMVNGHVADPGVERLLEGVAFLNANLQQKLDDDFPEIINELSETLNPWDLRPVPATTIVAFTPKAEVTQPLLIAAGTEVASIPVQGTKYIFRTCYDIIVHPLTLLDASFSHPSGKPPSVTLQCRLNGIRLSDWAPKSLRFYLGEDYPAACDLYLLLMRYLKCIVIASPDNGASFEISPECMKPVGFADDEIILAKEKRSLSGRPILQEYFLFQDKFLFIDLNGLDSCRALGDGSRFDIKFELAASPLVEPQVTEKSFVLFATPVINLFNHKAKPVTVMNDAVRQKIHPAGTNPDHYRLHSVDRITGVDVETVERTGYLSQKALLHYFDSDHSCRITHSKSPLGDGVDTFISIPRQKGRLLPSRTKLNIDLTCTNGSLPEQLKIGDVRIATASTSESVEFSNITPVRAAIDPAPELNQLWRVLSTFSLNRTALEDVKNLRASLRLFISSNSHNQTIVKANLKRLEGIESIEAKPTDRLIGRSMYRGYEVRLKLRREHFTGPGDLYLFSSVLERFLARYVTQSCFIRLVVEEISEGYQFEWPMRLGDKPST